VPAAVARARLQRVEGSTSVAGIYRSPGCDKNTELRGAGFGRSKVCPAWQPPITASSAKDILRIGIHPFAENELSDFQAPMTQQW